MDHQKKARDLENWLQKKKTTVFQSTREKKKKKKPEIHPLVVAKKLQKTFDN